MSRPSPLKTAPDFTLPNQKREVESLAGFLAKGDVLLAFHRATW
jgi:peroxiredoxin